MKTKIPENCLDIVNLIEKTPITRLNKEYQNKFIQKIKNSFTETQQHLFVASFYCLLNYNSKTDFVIDFDNVWKWLGFSRKDPCKVVLEKHFTIDVDYIIKKENTKVTHKISEEKAAPEISGAGKSLVNLGGAGLNKETILLNINTFKKLCLKSNTTKADEIHDYYIKLEETFQEILNEESEELKLQLQQQKQINIQDKETVLLQNYHKKSIVYFILISGILWKFGHTTDIHTRLLEHKRDIGKDITLIWCIESKDNMLLESELKEYLKKTNLRKEQKFKTHKGILKIQTELIEINDISIIQKKVIKINNYIELDNTLKFKKIEELELKINELQSENNQLKTLITNTNEIINENTNENTIKTITGELKIKPTRIRIRRENVLENISSDEEKQKFITWLNSNVQKNESKDNCALNWCTLLTKYLGYKTNPMISGKFRAYFQEYIGKEYIYSNFKYKGKTHNGWRNLSLIN